MARIGFITGIEKEAAILRGKTEIPEIDICCAGASTDDACRLASKLVQNGCELLISFGVAGALSPKLKAGDLVLPRSVVDGRGEILATDLLYHKKLTSHLSQRMALSDGNLYGSTALISDAIEKRRLHQTLGSVAVDIESLGIAKAAREQGCPFLIVRAISDTAEQNLPAACLNAIDGGGEIQISKVLLDLAKNPTDLPDLIRLGNNSRKAFATLGRVAALGFAL
ncbi:MAG: phosphorylase [Rhodospirillaceae bacterium]|nr:phosphorylase [Rhodospirillaceae bacterium]MBT4937790.1 phosphorylase [Rhodospirillaceae bacterium]MBT5938278.1 phosphorylase [Rhodospirillaceae bacterium]MBT7267932.1 phosphorylase [Rhodospirillaceae bacterium]